MAIARPLPQELPEERSRRGGAWAALLRRDAAAAAPGETVSFAELVWAHHERQEKEVYEGLLEGPWHTEYARRLERFQAQHGEIIEAYWCRYKASGAALTERKQRRRLTNFLLRPDSIMALHTATDWRTADAPKVTATLHRWQTTAIKAREILRGTSERIALHRIFGATTRLLACVDRELDDEPIAKEKIDELVEQHHRELGQVNHYYRRAGENAARIVYFRGMIWGTALLAVLAGCSFLAMWWAGWVDPEDRPTYTLLIAVAMGAAGAVLSVMTRMAREGFNLEFEVGRKSVRYLGGIRPWIGALSALAVYLALQSDLVEFLQASGEKETYFYATIAFVSGFSERRAKVLLDRLADDGGGREKDNEKTKETQ